MIKRQQYIVRALILFIKTLALYESFTYLLTYLKSQFQLLRSTSVGRFDIINRKTHAHAETHTERLLGAYARKPSR